MSALESLAKDHWLPLCWEKMEVESFDWLLILSTAALSVSCISMRCSIPVVRRWEGRQAWSMLRKIFFVIAWYTEPRPMGEVLFCPSHSSGVPVAPWRGSMHQKMEFQQLAGQTLGTCGCNNWIWDMQQVKH